MSSRSKKVGNRCISNTPVKCPPGQRKVGNRCGGNTPPVKPPQIPPVRPPIISFAKKNELKIQHLLQ